MRVVAADLAAGHGEGTPIADIYAAALVLHGIVAADLAAEHGEGTPIADIYAAALVLHGEVAADRAAVHVEAADGLIHAAAGGGVVAADRAAVHVERSAVDFYAGAGIFEVRRAVHAVGDRAVNGFTILGFRAVKQVQRRAAADGDGVKPAIGGNGMPVQAQVDRARGDVPRFGQNNITVEVEAACSLRQVVGARQRICSSPLRKCLAVVDVIVAFIVQLRFGIVS